MNIQITGRHLDITQPIRDFVNEKFAKLERHFDQITQIHVILSVVKETHIAEGKVNLAGAVLFAESDTHDLYAAIDGLIDKLDRQIVKHKEKVKDHHAHASKFENFADGQTEE